MFGPSRAPALRAGDRATCLYRDCDEVSTSWTDAPVSWPRCHLGLLVNDELARAVRWEGAAAAKHWFRAGTQALCRWRRSRGVTRTNCEGTETL